MLSRISYFSCLLLMLYASFSFYPRRKQPHEQATIAWDVSGYYWYLPSVFIYKDLKHQQFKDSVLKKYAPTPDFQEAFLDSSSGNYVMKYSSGMAVMFLPYFTAAHFAAKAMGYPADGFSAPYQFAIQVGGLIMSLIGLWYFRRFLKKYYSDTVVALALFILVFGTNYLNYGAIDTGMSHTWLFTLYVFLLLSTRAYYEKPNAKYAAITGFLMGLLTLTRPTEAISCLIPLLWGMESFSAQAIRERLAFFKKNLKFILVTAVCAAAVVSVQMMYWKYASGHWIVYSYQDQGFSWLHPHLYDYPLSFRSGWFTFTPMMMFAFVGLIPFVKYGRNRIMILSFFLLNFYVVSSWDIWWFGGRAMVQSYPILILPIATLLEVMLRKKVWLIILGPIFILFLYINIWFTYIEHAGNAYDPYMNNPYYWSVIGRFTIPEEKKKLLDRYDKIYTGTLNNKKLLYENDFENDTENHCSLPPIAGNRSLCLDKAHPYSKSYSFAYTPQTPGWVRAEATFYRPMEAWEPWHMAQFILKFYNSTAEVKKQMISVDRFMHHGNKQDLWIDTEMPTQPFNSISISFYNGDEDKIVEVDNLKVWRFED